MKNRNSKLLIGFISITHAISANATLTKGTITTKENTNIPYIYESDSNTYGLNVENLIQVSIVKKYVNPETNKQCAQFRNYLKWVNANPSESEVRSYFDTKNNSFDLEFSFLKEYTGQEIDTLVVNDLKEKKIISSDPENLTFIGIQELKPKFNWEADSLTKLSGDSIKQSAEKQFNESWEIIRKKNKINAKVSIRNALPTMVCDFQQGKLGLQISYLLANDFNYRKPGELKKDFFMKIWEGIYSKKESISKYSKKSEFLNEKDALILTNGIFLSQELIENGKNPASMGMDKVERIYLDLFNYADGSVNKDYTNKIADERAKSFGTPVTIEIATHRGEK